MFARSRASTPPPFSRGPTSSVLKKPAANSSERKDIVRTPRPYEFGGNVGTSVLMFLIPFCVYWAYGVNVMKHGEVCVPDVKFWRQLVWELPDGIAVRPTQKGLCLLSGWFFLQLAFQQFMPGRMEGGVKLKNGRRLPYKLNGWKSWCATWVLIISALASGHLDATELYRNFGSLMTWANIISYVAALYLYVHFGLFWRRWADSPEFESDWGTFKWTDFFHDYFMGCARNPRIFHFLGYPLDLKVFFEARPGLMLWVLANWSNLASMYYSCDRYYSSEARNVFVQCAAEGGFDRVPMSMLFVCVAHHYYICDYFWNEQAILTTTDIRHEQFGWMLVWGDFGFVPWMYSNSFTGYLANVRPRYASNVYLESFCLVVWIAAMILFRLTNSQKHNFRTYVTCRYNLITGFKIWGKQVTCVRTKEGNLLLTSGFWGMIRHPNYLPDMIMACVWCLSCACHQTVPIVPLGYLVFFFSAAIRRLYRDERRCEEKYGDDWAKYVKKVPYRLIPRVW